MRPGVRLTSALVAVSCFWIVGAAAAHAQLSDTQKKCFQAIGKAGAGFVKGRLKLEEKCLDAKLKDGGCTAPDAGKVQKEIDKLEGAIGKGCAFNGTVFGQAANLANMGFPGPCDDPDEMDGFTLEDLKTCIESTHEAIIDQLIDLEYDPTIVMGPPLSKDDLRCQKEVGKQGGKFVTCVLKNVQKCRNAILTGKLVGILPDNCAADDPKASAAIGKCVAKLESGVTGKCTNAQTTSLKLCTPDQTDAALAADCLHQSHVVRTDGPAIDVPADLIDYEYATRGGLCGDGVVNSLDEECDGADDSACPGQCGTPLVPDGYFACLCKTKPRQRVAEHANADVDAGWTGTSADGGVVEGGGFVVDLYDCDGSGNCIVGPSCSSPPHAACAVPKGAASGTTGDSICAGLGQGTCRKERTAVGPHCFKNIQKKCDPQLASDPICSDPGDFCVKSLHGPPVPSTAGGSAVCAVKVLSEDVVGTANVLTGAISLHVREDSITYQSLGSLNKPCPVCGGFCTGDRERCDVDADCAMGQGPCVTAPLCSDGPNQGKTCRPTAPFGGASLLFGVTSVDCPPNPASDISSGGLDILVDPRTTGTAVRPPLFPCTDPSFAGNACAGGANEGAPCTAASECPSATCSPQCLCAGQQKPNACDPACLGGANDMASCAVNSQCPGGFCHLGDCRVDPLDLDSTEEGRCTVGPIDGSCSISKFRQCLMDADCQGASCPFCQPGETCVFENRPCFPAHGIVRTGTVGTPERTVVGTYCIPATSNSSINTVGGFPGPGAVMQPEMAISVP